MEDKVVIITGASSGIGKGIALHFASIGYKKLALVARRADLLKETAQECRKLGATDTITMNKDLKDEKQCKEVISETVAKMGALHILIGNAGGAQFNKVRDMPVEVFKSTIDVNLTANFILTKHALPHLEKTRGNIVYIGSTAGQAPVMPNCADYTASKGALQQFAKSVALEEAAKGIRVNVVSPGPVAVETLIQMHGKDPKSEQGSQEARDKMKDWQPLGRIGTPQEMGKLVAFVVSDENSFMTGSVVLADGGMCLTGYSKLKALFPEYS